MVETRNRDRGSIQTSVQLGSAFSSASQNFELGDLAQPLISALQSILQSLGLGNLFNFHAEGTPEQAGLSAGTQNGPVASASSSTASSATSSIPSLQGQNVILWGDSIAKGAGAHLNGAASIDNQGVNGRGIGIGSNTPDIPNVSQGDVVIISMGTNDLVTLAGANSQAIERYADRLADMAERVVANGGIPVVLGPNEVDAGGYNGNAAFGPQMARSYNRAQDALEGALERELGERGITFVSTDGVARSSDGLHPSGTGYAQIFDRINDTLGANAPQAAPAAPVMGGPS